MRKFWWRVTILAVGHRANTRLGLCWISVGLCMLLLTIGLWNATLTPSEKGFYAMSFLLALFGGVAVQKNVRDLAMHTEMTAPPRI